MANPIDAQNAGMFSAAAYTPIGQPIDTTATPGEGARVSEARRRPPKINPREGIALSFSTAVARHQGTDERLSEVWYANLFSYGHDISISRILFPDPSMERRRSVRSALHCHTRRFWIKES